MSTQEAPLIRLSKIMAHRGLCSRREADELIKNGFVKVNGEIVSELGVKFLESVSIEVTGQGQKQLEDKLSIILYKPLGYVSGPKEERYPSALDLIQESNRSVSCQGLKLKPHLKTGLAPAGRLDVDSTGLLVLTAFGPLARKLIEKDSTIAKEYRVKVSGTLTDESLEKLQHGLSLDNVVLKPALVEWVTKNKILRFVLKEGRKRQIRRMCDLVDLKVTALKRVHIGPLNLKHLTPGQWRYLTTNEINEILNN